MKFFSLFMAFDASMCWAINTECIHVSLLFTRFWRPQKQVFSLKANLKWHDTRSLPRCMLKTQDILSNRSYYVVIKIRLLKPQRILIYTILTFQHIILQQMIFITLEYIPWTRPLCTATIFISFIISKDSKYKVQNVYACHQWTITYFVALYTVYMKLLSTITLLIFPRPLTNNHHRHSLHKKHKRKHNIISNVWYFWYSQVIPLTIHRLLTAKTHKHTQSRPYKIDGKK